MEPTLSEEAAQYKNTNKNVLRKLHKEKTSCHVDLLKFKKKTDKKKKINKINKDKQSSL